MSTSASMSEPPSPHRTLLALAPFNSNLHPDTPASTSTSTSPQSSNWQPILQLSNQVVLYNPHSHALSIRHGAQALHTLPGVHGTEYGDDLCPYCRRPLPGSGSNAEYGHGGTVGRHDNYFQLLEVAHEAASRPSTPPPHASVASGSSTSSINRARSRSRSQPRSGSPRYSNAEDGDAAGGGEGRWRSEEGAFAPGVMAQGYFGAFFQEERRLGMGANGTVYLCQHVLDGNPLGRFAVKKIAIGESHAYLIKILREVRLLETLHHPNIVTYHHAWLEAAQFSSFGPRVPTLHVLMQWAECGSLDDFIDTRLGLARPPPPDTSSNPTTRNPDADGTNAVADADDDPDRAKAARIRAFRAARRASPNAERRAERGKAEREKGRAVHLMSAEEVRGLFGDVVEGLAFLHGRAILHLDLKPGNVLLTREGGKLIPRAMLSDFGTSRDMVMASRAQRSGNTGTLEYTAPESLPDPRTGALGEVDSKTDMWSLGMVLHRMLFFRLPYVHASGGDGAEPDRNKSLDRRGGTVDQGDALEGEVRRYTGFKKTREIGTAFASRRLPHAYLVLLETLLCVVPMQRPTCERVVGALRDGRFDPEVPSRRDQNADGGALSIAVRSQSQPQPQPGVLEADEAATSAQIEPVDEKSGVDVDRDRDGDKHAPDYRHAHGARWNSPLSMDVDPSSPLLALPAPPESAWASGVRAWIPALALLRTHALRRRGVLVRGAKACALIIKVWTLATLCSSPGPSLPHTLNTTLTAPPEVRLAPGDRRPLNTLTALILALAIVDSLSESVLLSLMLALAHWALLSFVCSLGPELCCTTSLY